MRLKKELIIVMIQSEAQDVNLKKLGWLFQVLPFRLEKMAKNEYQFP